MELWAAFFVKNELSSPVMDTYSVWRDGYLERVKGRAPVTRIEGDFKYFYYIPEIQYWMMQEPIEMLNSVRSYFDDFDSFSIWKPPYVPRGAKNFLYLTQIPGEPSEEFRTNLTTSDSDVIYITYKTPQSGPNFHHFPNSTWGSGRNKLLELALEKEDKQRKKYSGCFTEIGWKYRYLIFMDGDVSLLMSVNTSTLNPWRRIEEV